MRRILVLTSAVLLAAASAASASFKTGSYSGKTSQNLSLSFTASKSKITHLGFKARFHCSSFRPGLFSPPVASHDVTSSITSKGTFEVKFIFAPVRDIAYDHVFASGKLTGKSASGKLREVYKHSTSPYAVCDTGQLTWNAATR